MTVLIFVAVGLALLGWLRPSALRWLFSLTGILTVLAVVIALGAAVVATMILSYGGHH